MSFKLSAPWLASGALFGISFVVPQLYFCFVPAFVLLLYAISSESSYWRLFLFGSICGTLHIGGALFWFWNALPIMWLKDMPLAIQALLIGFAWILTAISIGVSTGLFAVGVKRIGKSTGLLYVFVPVLWLLSQILGSLFFSIYTLGPGSFVHAGFSYGYIGYLLAEHGNYVQLSAFAGVYGLTFIAAMFGVFAYQMICYEFYKRSKLLLLAFSVLVIAAFIPLMPIHEKVDLNKNVHVIETYFTMEFLSNENSDDIKNAAMLRALGKALDVGAETILMPEDVKIENAFASREMMFSWIIERTGDREILIIGSGVDIDSTGSHVVRTYIYDTSNHEVYTLDKKYLVPQGEFLPYFYRAFVSLFASADEYQNIQDYLRFKSGQEPDLSVLPPDAPGILFCFETTVPYGIFRSVREREVDFIAHQVSHTWFTDPDSLEYQLNSMLRVQSVWNNLPIVTASNQSVSRLYTPSGSVVEGELLAQEELWSLKLFSF